MDTEPTIRIIRGTPSAEELAALVGVLRGLARRADGPPVISRWAMSTRPTFALRAGPGAWRASALPR